MSKWTDIRDRAVAEAKEAKIDEAVKQSVARKFYDDALPALREVVDSFTEAIKEQSKTESGWVKIRDAIVLPACIQGTLWAIELLLGHTIKKTAPVAVASAAQAAPTAESADEPSA